MPCHSIEPLPSVTLSDRRPVLAGKKKSRLSSAGSGSALTAEILPWKNSPCRDSQCPQRILLILAELTVAVRFTNNKQEQNNQSRI